MLSGRCGGGRQETVGEVQAALEQVAVRRTLLHVEHVVIVVGRMMMATGNGIVAAVISGKSVDVVMAKIVRRLAVVVRYIIE